MNSIKRLGIFYGRLGLSTDPTLIERRSAGVAVVADALDDATVVSLVRRSFGLGLPDASITVVLDKFRDQDPTFDVAPEDAEMSLLAAAILDYVMENKGEFSAIAALSVVAAAAGGLRRPVNHDDLLGEAERVLVYFQGLRTPASENCNYNAMPKSLIDAIGGIPSVASFQQALSPVRNAFEELKTYTEANVLASEQNNKAVLNYVRQLEGELHLYWWVVGGWSADVAKPFRRMNIFEVALRSGKELADKVVNNVGVFAAPAMLDMILERGRGGREFSNIRLCDAAVATDKAWRLDTFAQDDFADILPVSTSLRLAAESDDEDDWYPRFFRLTNISVDVELTPLELSLQLYRERLVAKAFA